MPENPHDHIVGTPTRPRNFAVYSPDCYSCIKPGTARRLVALLKASGRRAAITVAFWDGAGAPAMSIIREDLARAAIKRLEAELAHKLAAGKGGETPDDAPTA